MSRVLQNPKLFPPLEEARYAELEMVETDSTHRELYVFKPRRYRRYVVPGDGSTVVHTATDNVATAVL